MAVSPINSDTLFIWFVGHMYHHVPLRYNIDICHLKFIMLSIINVNMFHRLVRFYFLSLKAYLPKTHPSMCFNLKNEKPWGWY